MEIRFTHSFEKDYRELPGAMQVIVDKKLVLLLKNFRHPSLRMKKMEGYRNVWEVRVTLGISADVEHHEQCLCRSPHGLTWYLKKSIDNSGTSKNVREKSCRSNSYPLGDFCALHAVHAWLVACIRGAGASRDRVIILGKNKETDGVSEEKRIIESYFRQ